MTASRQKQPLRSILLRVTSGPCLPIHFWLARLTRNRDGFGSEPAAIPTVQGLPKEQLRTGFALMVEP